MFDHLTITNCSKGMAKGHFATYIIVKKILDVGYWWPTLFKHTHDFCTSCDNCQKFGGPTEYVLLAINGDHKDVKFTKVLIAKIT